MLNQQVNLPEEFLENLFFVIKAISVTLSQTEQALREAVVCIILEFFRPQNSTKEEYYKNLRIVLSNMFITALNYENEYIFKSIENCGIELKYQDLQSTYRFEYNHIQELVLTYTTFNIVYFISPSIIPQHPIIKYLFLLYLPYYMAYKNLIDVDNIYTGVLHITQEHTDFISNQSLLWMNNFNSYPHFDAEAIEKNLEYFGDSKTE